MSDYQRFISYIYSYDGNTKMKNTGFAKVEDRQGVCRMSIRLKGITTSLKDLEAFVFYEDQGKLKTLPIGSIHLNNGSGELFYQGPSGKIGTVDMELKDVWGVFIKEPYSNKRIHMTCWNDKQFHVSDLWEDNKTQKPEGGLTESTRTEEIYTAASSEKKVFNETLSEDTYQPIINRAPEPADWPAYEEPHEREPLSQPNPENPRTPQPTPMPEMKPMPIPEMQPTPIPQMQPTPMPEMKPTPMPEMKATPIPEMKPTPTPEMKPTPMPEMKPTPMPEMKPTPMPEMKPTPMPKMQPDPAPEIQSISPEAQSIHMPESESSPENSSEYKESFEAESGTEQVNTYDTAISSDGVKEVTATGMAQEHPCIAEFRQNHYPRIMPPINDGQWEIIAIMLQDLKKLPELNQALISNAFILRGVERYNYLAFIINKKDSTKCLLGVPGRGTIGEKNIALNYGFELFLPVTKARDREIAGFWCVPILI